MGGLKDESVTVIIGQLKGHSKAPRCQNVTPTMVFPPVRESLGVVTAWLKASEITVIEEM